MTDDIKVFVYGTLKQGFPNHFLLEGKTEVKYLGKGTTVDRYPLVVGSRYNVPYILGCRGTGHQIEGEVYSVSTEVLGYLDELECYPRLYNRVTLPVTLADSGVVQADCYVLDKYKPEMLDLTYYKKYEPSEKQAYVKPSDRTSNTCYWSDVMVIEGGS